MPIAPEPIPPEQSEESGSAGAGGVIAAIQHPTGDVIFPGSDEFNDDYFEDMVLTVPGDNTLPTVLITTITQLSMTNTNLVLRIHIRDSDGNYYGGFGPVGTGTLGITNRPFTAMGLIPPFSGEKEIRVYIGTSAGDSVTVSNVASGPGDVQNTSMIAAFR